MDKSQLIAESLRQPKDAITYFVGQSLAAMLPDRAVLYGSQSGFDVEEFAEAGLCGLTAKDESYAQVDTSWYGPEYPLNESVQSGWYDVSWSGHALEVLWISVIGKYTNDRYHWIVGDSTEVAKTFLAAVVDWNSALRDEVYYFEGGCWHKSKELYRSIQDSTFERLIMPEAMKQELQNDFSQFFASRDVYSRYRLPWKRGVLFIGPPGNGKTHTVKSLINWLGVDCLYVKSFKAQYSTDHSCIQSVFEMARKTTPCVLVMEDLDSLVNDKNRSFFLNEMDGFMSNNGILVLATTNHPERLDPAILERPSRFDRKYFFELPAPTEREAYLSMWNSSVEADLQMSPDGIKEIVAVTDDFSYAYMKELWLLSMVRWINTGVGVGSASLSMDEVMSAQVDILREQMKSATEAKEQGSLAEMDVSTNKRMIPHRVRTIMRTMGVSPAYMPEGFGAGFESMTDEDESED